MTWNATEQYSINKNYKDATSQCPLISSLIFLLRTNPQSVIERVNEELSFNEHRGSI